MNMNLLKIPLAVAAIVVALGSTNSYAMTNPWEFNGCYGGALSGCSNPDSDSWNSGGASLSCVSNKGRTITVETTDPKGSCRSGSQGDWLVSWDTVTCYDAKGGMVSTGSCDTSLWTPGEGMTGCSISTPKGSCKG